MANRGTNEWISGLATLRATQRQPRVRRYATGPSIDAESPAADDEASPPADRTGHTRPRPMGIGRTTMPTQNEVVCYGCGFQFVVRGRTTVTQCPKCGARLSMKDETITGGFHEECVTAGKVTLTRSAIVDGGKITANDILLEGIIKSGQVRAHKMLTLAKGAELPEDLLDARSLKIGPEASFDFERTLELHDVEVCGELKARIKATGTVTVRASGHLLGQLMAKHLIVEEGGGLNCALDVQPNRTTWSSTEDATESTVAEPQARPLTEPPIIAPIAQATAGDTP